MRVTRLALDLRADFAARQLAGTATLSLAWQRPGAATPGAPDRLILDTRDLAIEKVEAPGARGAWRALPFTVGQRDPILGSPLTIAADRTVPEVRVTYRTRPQASGLQWLAPALTDGGKQPFLFTQSQAIHARSWVPLQDTPGVRFTYAARIRHAEGARRRDERRQRSGRRARRRLPLRDAAADPVVPARARGRRPRVQAALGARRRVGGARRRRSGGRRVRRHRADDPARPRRCTARTAGAATTCWSCRRASRSAAWRTRASPSSRRR